jgi:hypothetical protein
LIFNFIFLDIDLISMISLCNRKLNFRNISTLYRVVHLLFLGGYSKNSKRYKIEINFIRFCMKNGIKKTLFNNWCVHRFLVVQFQNVSDMRVKVVQTNLCCFQVISILLQHEFSMLAQINIRMKHWKLMSEKSCNHLKIAQICLNNFYSHIRNVLRLYDKQTVYTPIIKQSLFNSIFHVEFNKIYFNFVPLTVFAVPP